MSIESLMADINKEFGAGTIATLVGKKNVPVDVIPFGIEDLDIGVIGCGGLPRGRITEIYGAESGGKTTLALTAVANAQRMGMACAYIDAENALDPTWMSTIGVDTDKLLICQPDSGEESLSIAIRIVESGEIPLVVIDSVAALTPQVELDGEMSDAQMGAQARMMGKAMRKLTGPAKTANAAVVFINQIREKMGVTFGSNTTTPGGRALKFAASLRLEVTRIGSFKKGEEIIGNNVKIKVAKNKLAAPFKSAEFQLRFDSGFDIYGGILDKLIQSGEVVAKGAWFIAGDLKMQGREAAVQWVKEKYGK